jgi:hypothetical protein
LARKFILVLSRDVNEKDGTCMGKDTVARLRAAVECARSHDAGSASLVVCCTPEEEDGSDRVDADNMVKYLQRKSTPVKLVSYEGKYSIVAEVLSFIEFVRLTCKDRAQLVVICGEVHQRLIRAHVSGIYGLEVLQQMKFVSVATEQASFCERLTSSIQLWSYRLKQLLK